MKATLNKFIKYWEKKKDKYALNLYKRVSERLNGIK